MYYSSGNYEAFARPRKPASVDNKAAWFVGSGLASLAGAAFLVRDGRMPGERITILEQQQIAGGALDGLKVPEKGFVIRGGREMEDHFECLWDLFRSIPSLEIDDASVLDEFYWLNKDDPNYSLQRATINRGEDAHTDGLFTLSEQAQKDVIALFLATRQEMENKRINEVLGRDFLDSNFWLYWRVRGMALGAGDEAVPASFHPPYRRAAGFLGAEVHQVQPVRIAGAAAGEVAAGARRAVPVRH